MSDDPAIERTRHTLRHGTTDARGRPITVDLAFQIVAQDGGFVVAIESAVDEQDYDHWPRLHDQRCDQTNDEWAATVFIASSAAGCVLRERRRLEDTGRANDA